MADTIYSVKTTADTAPLTTATAAQLNELVGGSQTSLHSHAGGGGYDYTEKTESWAAVGTGSWEEKDLSGYNVPANAVCEIMVVNSNSNAEYEGGVRAVGSALARLVDLHEAEAGGVSVVTMHVKADANSKIEQYAENASVSFTLLGYWS